MGSRMRGRRTLAAAAAMLRSLFGLSSPCHQPPALLNQRPWSPSPSACRLGGAGEWKRGRAAGASAGEFVCPAGRHWRRGGPGAASKAPPDPTAARCRRPAAVPPHSRPTGSPPSPCSFRRYNPQQGRGLSTMDQSTLTYLSQHFGCLPILLVPGAHSSGAAARALCLE